MRVGLHDYRTDPHLPQKDGVNFAHENIAQLLRSDWASDLDVEFHDFNSLLRDLGHAREALADVDCIVSNVGPHAHYYFWLRDQLKLNYRIVRDVRTALWSSYLFQEHLCTPFIRPHDALMVASNYVWGVYEHIFPHLANYPTLLCYPLSISFPLSRPAHRNYRPAARNIITLGYLGRLSEDKNFPDVVELLIRLNHEASDGQRYRLIACGEIYSPCCAPERVHAQITEKLGNGPWYEYLPARDHSEIWSLFERFDVMIFPSTSNLETFGRVLIEASFARVPVITGRHAACPELVDCNGLCEVDYVRGRPFVTHFNHCLGRVNITSMATAISSGKFAPSPCYEHYSKHHEILIDFLRRPSLISSRPALSASQKAFINSLEMTIKPLPDLKNAREAISELVLWFLDLQRKGTPEYAGKIKRLREISPYPQRTERFISKSAATKGDFTNVGGIDIELCHIHQFYPHFTIQPDK